MAETGVSRTEAEKMAAEMAEAEEAGVVRLPAWERPLIDLVMASLGRWRVASGLRVIKLGFDLVQIDVAARWMGITPDARLLEGLGIIERAALSIMERRE